MEEIKEPRTIPGGDEIITDANLSKFVLALKGKGYVSDPKVWDLSVGRVEYITSTNFACMYSAEDRLYDLHPWE